MCICMCIYIYMYTHIVIAVAVGVYSYITQACMATYMFCVRGLDSSFILSIWGFDYFYQL